MKEKRSWQNVKRLLTIQLVLCILVSLSVWLLLGRHQAVSVLLGGIVAWLPSAIFAKKFFHYQGASAAKKIVKSFYIGEFLKIISSVILFTLVFLLYEVNPLAFFLTYILVVFTHWFSPLIIDYKHNR